MFIPISYVLLLFLLPQNDLQQEEERMLVSRDRAWASYKRGQDALNELRRQREEQEQQTKRHIYAR